MSPTLGTPTTWTVGTWTSQLCLNSLGRFKTGTDRSWGFLKWDEENTEDETEAYIRVDILDSSGNALVSGLSRRTNGHDLSTYTAIGSTANIYVRVKLYGKTKKPICKNLTMKFKSGGL